jgi:hypothetical protein
MSKNGREYENKALSNARPSSGTPLSASLPGRGGEREEEENSSNSDIILQGTSTVTKNFRDMRGKGFFGQTRRERRAYPHGSARNEQRSLAEKDLTPCGLRRICPGAVLLVAHRPMKGMHAPRALPQAKCDATHVSRIHCHSTGTLQLFRGSWVGAGQDSSRQAQSVPTVRVHSRFSLTAPRVGAYWRRIKPLDKTLNGLRRKLGKGYYSCRF